jgi:hypothetical protein
MLVDLATRFYVAGQSQIEIARARPRRLDRLPLPEAGEGRGHRARRDPAAAQLHGDLALELADAFHLKKAVVVTGAQAHPAATRCPGGRRLREQPAPERHAAWTLVGRMLSAAIHKMPTGTGL